MSRYIDADLIHYFKTFNPNKKDICVADMAWRSDIDAVPTADVVEREKYERLLESAKILADAVKEYEKRFEDEQSL